MHDVRRVLTVALFLAACTIAGCSGDSPVDPAIAPMVGAWDLQTVEGAPLPFIWSQDGAAEMDVTGMTISATARGTFTEVETYVFPTLPRASGTYTASGTYALKGDSVVLMFLDSTTQTGTLSSNTLTLDAIGLPQAVYRKR